MRNRVIHVEVASLLTVPRLGLNSNTIDILRALKERHSRISVDESIKVALPFFSQPTVTLFRRGQCAASGMVKLHFK